MYAILNYNINWTLQNVLDDVVAVATGSTDLNTLSTPLSKTTSSINTSTSAGGWTLHDDVDASTKILRAPIHDDPTKYKYIRIRIVDSTYIAMDFYKDWDNVAHTGTVYDRRRSYTDGMNENNTIAGYTNVIFHPNGTSSNETFTVCLSTSSSHFMSIHTQNNGSQLGKISFISEHERDNLWDTTAVGVNPVVFAPYGISWNPMFTSDQVGKRWYDSYYYTVEQWTLAKPECVDQLGNKRSMIGHTIENNSYYASNLPIHNTRFTMSPGNSYDWNETSRPRGTTLELAGVTRDNGMVVGSDGLGNLELQVPFYSLGVVDATPYNNYEWGGERLRRSAFDTSRVSTRCGLYMTYITNPGVNDVVVYDGANYRVWPMIDGAYAISASSPVSGWCFLVKE